jgi:hypothetical protein
VKPAILGVSALAVVFLGSVCVAAEDAAKSPAQSPAQSQSQSQSRSQSGDNSKAVQAADGASGSEKSAKSAKPQAAGKGQAARGSRLTKPWRDMSSLTEEQKKQIADIHRKAVQDKNVIEERENADIMALLNDQQKGELKTMKEKEAAEKKAKAGNRPAGGNGVNGASADEKAAKE